MTLRAILFDRDDTLSLTEQGMYMEAALWTQERFGLEPKITLSAMREQWASVEGKWQHLRTLEEEHQFWKEYALELGKGLNLTGEQALELVTEWPYYRFIKAVPEAREVLSKLREKGYKIGVLSNTLPNVAATLSAIEIHDLVDVAIASCTLGTHKPDLECFVQAAQLLEHAPHEILFVDDKLENVQAALELGMHALLINHHSETGESFKYSTLEMDTVARIEGEIHNLYGVLEYVEKQEAEKVS